MASLWLAVGCFTSITTIKNGRRCVGGRRNKHGRGKPAARCPGGAHRIPACAESSMEVRNLRFAVPRLISITPPDRDQRSIGPIEGDSSAGRRIIVQQMQIGRIEFRLRDKGINIGNGQAVALQHDQAIFPQGL